MIIVIWNYVTMLDPSDLAAFVAIAEHRHFGRAAEALGIVQSVASKRLKRLEDTLGGQLIERVNRSNIRLTRTGELFLDQAREAIALLEQAEHSGRKFACGTAGPLHIGYVFSAAMSGLLSRSVRALGRALPDVEPILEIMETPGQIDAIASGKIDVGFVRPRPSYPKGVHAARIHSEPFVLAMSRHNPLAACEMISPADLAVSNGVQKGPPIGVEEGPPFQII